MKVLILGGSGFVGQALVAAYARAASRFDVHVSARRAFALAAEYRDVPAPTVVPLADVLDAEALSAAIAGHDVVVDCVTGDAATIEQSARLLADKLDPRQRLIHMSSMAVYGGVEGTIREDHALAGAGWYGEAKCRAEEHVRRFVARGGRAVVLRPGCIYGPRSSQWTERIARLLQQGRLGDLGAAGDGWSNLVHVDDVAQAVVLGSTHAVDGFVAYNLAAPEGLRWNDYFVRFGRALGIQPVRRVPPLQLKLDTKLAGPAIKIAEKAIKRGLPDAFPPSLLRLFGQHVALDATAATRELGMAWQPLEEGIAASAAWWRARGAR